MLSPKTKCVTPVNRPRTSEPSIGHSLSASNLQSFKNVSTISNELRIGRHSSITNNNYIPSSALSDARSNKSPHGTSRRYSFPKGGATPSEHMNLRKMSNEQIIDLMEREQDAIVLKLMKEIESLKEENKSLKSSLSNALQSSSLPRRTSSLSSSVGEKESTRSSISSNSSFLNSKDEMFNTDRKKFKRKPSNEIPRNSVKKEH
ncbi:hypothetical protein CAAN3_01S03114 [[Candida] anglica]